MNRIDLGLLRDAVSEEVCRSCEFNDIMLPEERVCARTAVSVIVGMEASLESVSGFDEAPGDEVLSLDVGQAMPVETTKEEYLGLIDDVAAAVKEAASKCSLALSRHQLGQITGRIGTNEAFVPTSVFAKLEILDSFTPSE